MSSNSIYCVYHITYSGNKLPPNYIGSTSIKQIQSGYMGSVCSRKYKDIWNQELKEYPELFHLEIISYHDTRPEALYNELQIQKLFNVVKNPLFVNMSYAQLDGFAGRDVSGENNPMYGSSSQTGISTYTNILSGENKRIHKDDIILLSGLWVGITKNRKTGPHTDSRRKNISNARKGISNPWMKNRVNRVNCLDIILDKIYSVDINEFNSGKGIRYFGPNNHITKQWKLNKLKTGNFEIY